MAEVSLKPVEIAAKRYYDRATTALPYYLAGVKNPKRSPTAAALEMKDTLKEKMKRDETWDKWERRRRAAGDEGWLAGIMVKGKDRYVPGVTIGAARWADFYDKFAPKLKEVLSEVYSKPRVTVEDSIERVATLIRGLYGWTYEPTPMTAEELKSRVEKIRAIKI